MAPRKSAKREFCHHNASIVRRRVRGVIKGGFAHSLAIGKNHFDEFHDTKSDTAPVPRLVSA